MLGGGGGALIKFVALFFTQTSFDGTKKLLVFFFI